MLMVIKKNGRIENFISDKIKTSIYNCASENNILLNSKDLDIIANDVERKINRIRGLNSYTSSFEIQAIVLDVLHHIGYDRVADFYYKGSMK